MSVFVRNPGSLDLHKVAIMKVQSEDIDELAAQKVTYVDTQTQLGATNVQSAIQKLKTNFQGGVDSIYNACVAKGSTPASHSLSDVVAGINAIPTGITPTGTINIITNGTKDVTNYASANVQVPASAVVSGTKNITSNGDHDVTNYATARVSGIPTLDTYTFPEGSTGSRTVVAQYNYADATNVYTKGVDDGKSAGESVVLNSEAAYIEIPAGENNTSSVTISNQSWSKTLKLVAYYNARGNNPVITLDGAEVPQTAARFYFYRTCLIPPRTDSVTHVVSFSQTSKGVPDGEPGAVACIIYGDITTISDERSNASSGNVNIA